MERAEQKPTRHSTDKSDCGEQLCVAGVDDYQAVLDIATEVYHGLDYLPATFPKLVAGPGVRAYLYKLGDRVLVSLRMERAEQKPTRHSTDKSDCGEQLCVAGVDDYQAVLDIDTEVYHGLDYLPATFPKLVAGPGVRAYLYKLGDRVVGFNSTLLVDGGQTLVTSAGRMAADCRGGGICLCPDFSQTCGKAVVNV
nr:hypothetical protein BaRGS_002477 [Batillaria attramentaria]